MSNDQRPGKVRVFSSHAVEPPPARRRGDPPQRDTPSAVEGAARGPQVANVAGSSRAFMLAIPFLLGCAIGGAVVAWLGLIPGVVS